MVFAAASRGVRFLSRRGSCRRSRVPKAALQRREKTRERLHAIDRGVSYGTTAAALVISSLVWATYYRRKGQRRAGKRDVSVSAGLVVLGIYDRCTPALAAEVSLLAVVVLGSLAEAQDVLVV